MGLKIVSGGCLGFIDKVTDTFVAGWAIDRGRGEGGAIIFLFSDGKLIGNVECSDTRMDLAEAGLRTEQVAFQFELPDMVADGIRHTLTARFPSGDHLTFIDDDGTMNLECTVCVQPRPLMISCVDGLEGGVIKGWVAMREAGSSGPARGLLDVIVLHNGTELARLKADRYRSDVAKAMHTHPYCGFAFKPPSRLRDGGVYRLDFQLALTGESLDRTPTEFQFPTHCHESRIAQLANIVDDLSTQLWRIRRELSALQTMQTYTLADYHSWATVYQSTLRSRRRTSPWPSDRPTPMVSVLCPVYRPRLRDLKAAVASVIGQTYENWELILVDDRSHSSELTKYMREISASDARIRLIVHANNGGISAATNTAVAAAKGAYIALFDHDDLLEAVALEVMIEAALESDALVLYSDEDKIDDQGYFSDPNLKSDWNYRLLLAQNYVCHFLVVEAGVMQAVGPLRKKYDGAQDHDLVLRLTEMVDPARIVHVPEVIYHWRLTPGSTAMSIDAKSYAVEAGASAIRDHLKRRGQKVKVTPLAGITMYEVDWRFKEEPSISIIVPFREQLDMTRRCLNALQANTNYKNFQVILVDNWSSSREARALCTQAARSPNVQVLRIEEPFNYSRLNNLACAAFPADFFVFMNNDVVVEQRNWLRLLVNEALVDHHVAAVGAKLVYPDRTVQHGGVILGAGDVADHAYRGRAIDNPFFMGRGICAQQLSAVTGALMLCRADAFVSVGGFDEVELPIAYNDVDLCLKLGAAGGKVIYCPAVIAEHHESASRGDDMAPARMRHFIAEERTMLDRWPREIERDRFYNPLFSRQQGIFAGLADPVQHPERTTGSGKQG